jgi:tryptophan halogenase
MIQNILIVGGGSAGWMTAAYLVTKTNCKVTLVESANVPIIGVGESTIPSIADFMEDVGFTEQDLFDDCSAIRKYTIQHNGWKNGVDQWWHHFCFDESEHEEQLSWLQNKEVPNKKWRHAYHLDATKLGIALRDKVCVPKGVVHIVDDVIEVQHNDNGVTSVVGKLGQYTADLYIDCTGFKSLVRKTLGQEYLQHEALSNNYALCGPGDFVEAQVNYTQTYAMDYGWRWRVCIQNRTGNGYAFNKDLISIEDARKEFIAKTPGLRVDKIFEVPITNQFNPEPWKQNVLALGLSCGFLEPLEATGLFLIHGPVKMLVRLLNDDRRQDKYNRVWRNLYDHLADFLSLHYKTSELNHTDYWRNLQKVDAVQLPKDNQALFNPYSFRQLATARELPYTPAH